jgi:hypothetical protein
VGGWARRWGVGGRGQGLRCAAGTAATVLPARSCAGCAPLVISRAKRGVPRLSGAAGRARRRSTPSATRGAAGMQFACQGQGSSPRRHHGIVMSSQPAAAAAAQAPRRTCARVLLSTGRAGGSPAPKVCQALSASYTFQKSSSLVDRAGNAAAAAALQGGAQQDRAGWLCWRSCATCSRSAQRCFPRPSCWRAVLAGAGALRHRSSRTACPAAGLQLDCPPSTLVPPSQEAGPRTWLPASPAPWLQTLASRTRR